MTTAYWPNQYYFYQVLNSAQILIEQHEHYQKQSYRNRCRILSANGVLDLSVPVKKRGLKEYTRDVEINYQENWQNSHWRAITSAYRNSPFFEYFEPELSDFYTRQYPTLIGYNLAQLNFLLKILKQKKTVTFTTGYQKHPINLIDTRELIHPKRQIPIEDKLNDLLLRPYYQTFGTKFPFIPNLSILDLIFNTGMETVNYLKPLPANA